MFKMDPSQAASLSLWPATFAWTAQSSSDSHRSSISAPTAQVATTFTTTSSPSSNDTCPIIFYYFHVAFLTNAFQLDQTSHNIMSSTPVEFLERERHHSHLESPSNCEQCRPSQLQESSSQESSESSSSQSIQINVYAKKAEASVMKYEQLEKEIQQLQKQNRILSRKNKELMSILMPARDSQKQLKRTLKEKQLEIMQLKNQISTQSYGMSHASLIGENGLRSTSNIRYESKKNKSKSKFHRKHHQKQQLSAEPSLSQQFNISSNKLFRKHWQTQRQVLQNQLCQLQEKLLLYQSQLKWATNLASKLINLADTLAYVFKQKVGDRRWSLKRQAKSAWRYLKHILGYLLLNQSS